MVGSPPPTRGILQRLPPRPQAVGITPAYAGNTTVFLALGCLYGDHPRLRGEYLIDLSFYFAHRGSPPPTRGIHISDRRKCVAIGITPAYAGNTDWAYCHTYID